MTNPIFEVFYLKNARAVSADFSGNPPKEYCNIKKPCGRLNRKAEKDRVNWCTIALSSALPSPMNQYRCRSRQFAWIEIQERF